MSGGGGGGGGGWDLWEIRDLTNTLSNTTVQIESGTYYMCIVMISLMTRGETGVYVISHKVLMTLATFLHFTLFYINAPTFLVRYLKTLRLIRKKRKKLK